MSESQMQNDVDNCVNTPGEESYQPLKFDPRSWAMDAGDYMLPESEEDMRIIGIAVRNMLDADWWLSTCSDKYKARGATSLAYRQLRLGELILRACHANRLSEKMLEDLGDD